MFLHEAEVVKANLKRYQHLIARGATCTIIPDPEGKCAIGQVRFDELQSIVDPASVLCLLIERTAQAVIGQDFALGVLDATWVPEPDDELECTVAQNEHGVTALVTTREGKKILFEGRIHPPTH